MKPIEQLLTQIAQQHLDIETLERRWSDSLDFHDVAVWSIKAALEAAYQAGVKQGCRQGPKALGFSPEQRVHHITRSTTARSST